MLTKKLEICGTMSKTEYFSRDVRAEQEKKEIYEERRIAVFLSGVSLMRAGAGKSPRAFIHRKCVSHFFTS